MRTAEFVTPRHPDKMCDQISDSIVDWALTRDREARVAVETLGGHGNVHVVGEITVRGDTDDLPVAVKKIVAEITGRDDLHVDVAVSRQSPQIAQGVDLGGAGDQGIMRGYAVSETPNLMPREHELARSLCKHLFALFPHDGKTQVTLDNAGEIAVLVASFQSVSGKNLEEAMREWFSQTDYAKSGAEHIRFYANPAGDWTIGGFEADTGLTGRKLAVDNYGPRFPVGGGAFSGKDATKVDRSGAYIARRVAVDLMRERGGTDEMIEVELAYAIGVAEPVDIHVAAFKKDGAKEIITSLTKYDLTPGGIIRALDLRRPQYAQTAKWGHFGNGFAWDK